MCVGKRLLAVQENFGTVAECDCGTIHVTIGPVSVALDSHSLRRLGDLVESAIMKADSPGPAHPESFFYHSSRFESRKAVKLKH
jgi:hypothetical protein